MKTIVCKTESETEALGAARAALELGPFERDDAYLPNIHYIQFLYGAIARTYLPQVGYPAVSPLLSHLLAQADSR